jgi:hypothetical protein
LQRTATPSSGTLTTNHENTMQTENQSSKHNTEPKQETGEGCQERLVRLLPCPFCGSETEITDESMPDRPRSWFFARCVDWKGCCAWLAAKSPEAVALKWNMRSNDLTAANTIREYQVKCVQSYSESPTDYQKGVIQGLDCALSFLPNDQVEARRE